jgi:hypothetical protein
VLLDAHSPLQVTLAVLVSFWAHALHGLYKPWGAGSQTYKLQHASLTATDFLFLMGLLFKSRSVPRSSPVYLLLSYVMLLLCLAFLAAWVYIMVRTVYIGRMAEKRTRRVARSMSWAPVPTVMAMQNPMMSARVKAAQVLVRCNRRRK